MMPHLDEPGRYLTNPTPVIKRHTKHHQSWSLITHLEDTSYNIRRYQTNSTPIRKKDIKHHQPWSNLHICFICERVFRLKRWVREKWLTLRVLSLRNIHVDPLLTTPPNVRECRHKEWLVELQALQRLKNSSAYLIYGRSIFSHSIILCSQDADRTLVSYCLHEWPITFWISTKVV